MKKIAISTLAVLLACPAFAGNHHMDSSHKKTGTTLMGIEINPYVALRGGMSYTNLNYNYNNTKETVSDTVFQGRAAIGMAAWDAMRTEIEWSMFGKAKDSENFAGTTAEVKTDMQTLLMNTYWEIGDYHMIRPFVGVGAGVAMLDIKAPAKSDSNTRFSAMTTGGVTFDMMHFAVDVAARYNYVDVQSGLHNFGGDIGIRYMF